MKEKIRKTRERSPSGSRLTRRDFIAEGITSGFALAVLPVTALAITTSSEGIVSENFEISTSDKKKMPCYWAMPKGAGPYPVIFVIHEVFGVHQYIQDVCRRFAQAGYVAVSPYLYFREGDVTKIQDTKKIMSDIVSKGTMTQVLSDLDSAQEWLKKSKMADTKKLGITGFCWGGTIVWEYSSHNPNVKAGVAWYGRLSTTSSATPAKTPIELAPGLKVPVLGLYGGKDKGISLEDVEKMKKALKEGKSNSEIIVFSDAEHGFHADYRPSYHEASAKEGWSKALAWFKEHGV